jgi:hypothetical protein
VNGIGSNSSSTVSREKRGEDFGEEGSDEWGRDVSGWRRGAGHRFGIELDGLGAGSSAGPKWLPSALLLFSLFLFLISGFIQILYNFHSKQIE